MLLKLSCVNLILSSILHSLVVRLGDFRGTHAQSSEENTFDKSQHRDMKHEYYSNNVVNNPILYMFIYIYI